MTAPTHITVCMPQNVRRRPGRKTVVMPIPAASIDTANATTRGDPALVKALARGFRWRRLLEEGRYASIRDLAAAERVDRAYVGRVLNPTLLAPEVVEAILDGRHPQEMPLAALLEGALAERAEQRADLTGKGEGWAKSQ
jgi:hypothetical protein